MIDKYCNTKEGRLYTCFIDFHKAFDSVIHAGLKLKLLKMNIGSYFYNIIKDMYRNSEACIRIEENLTDPFFINLGVRQGDNLSPSLFKIFINDFPLYLEKCIDAVSLQNESLNCLMYADDIVIMSTSAEGLQQRISILETYCNDWCLKINIKKTKVMVFNKAGRIMQCKFKLQNNHIECTPCYKYLGTYFSASGSFSTAKTELYNTALKGFFKLKKDFLSLAPSIETSTHLFDHTIKPILLYNSEIWGGYIGSWTKIKSSFDPDKFFKSLHCEKLHQKYSKCILGVHKKSTNFAVLSELGRFPLHHDILKSVICYWYRLENLNKFQLLKDAYLCSKSMHFNNKLSWYSLVQKALEYFEIEHQSKDFSQYKFKKTVKNHLRKKYIEIWYNCRSKMIDGKLCTYFKLKEYFGFEKYLKIIKNFDLRRSICKLRISAHRLMIEVGRYSGITRSERICNKCNSGLLGDEIHFLIKCDKFVIERKSFYDVLENAVPNFSTLNDEQKYMYILSSEELSILNPVAKFIKENM